MDDTIEVQADFKSRLARKKERDTAEADTVTAGLADAEASASPSSAEPPSTAPAQKLVEGENSLGAGQSTTPTAEKPELVDVTTNATSTPKPPPRNSKSTPPEVWRLVGPGLRQFPSMDYLRKLESVKPGTISGLLASVQIDLDLTREQYETAHNNAITITTTRVIAYLCYAGFAFLGAITLYLLGFMVPGTICAGLSIIALILSTSFFTQSKTAAHPPQTAPPSTSPQNRRRRSANQNSPQSS